VTNFGHEIANWSQNRPTTTMGYFNPFFVGDDKAETFQRIAQMDYSFEDEDFAGISQDAKVLYYNFAQIKPA